MFKRIRPVTLYSLARKAGLSFLGAYAGILTVLLLRLSPKPLLIGIDPYGTRIIEAGGDRLLRQEKENFLKHFLSLTYSFDQATFEKRISDAGDLMSEALWAGKKAEFGRVSSELKSSELTQAMDIESLREVDASHFEADLVLHIKNRLSLTTVNLRVSLGLRAVPRRSENPYPFEVTEYDEVVL